MEGSGVQAERTGGRHRCPGLPRLALAALAAYALLLWISRPVAPFEWDEVLFQRAVLHYDVATHSPHPPGFPAYVGAAKAVDAVTRNPLLALQIVGVLAAVAAVAATWALARRLGVPPAAAAAAAALVAASPEFLYSAALGISDVPGTAAAVVAALALAAAAGRPALLPLAGAACGLLAGIRPQSGAVLVPALVWAVVVAARGRRWRDLALGAVAALAVAAACWVPAIAVTGPQRWWAATASHLRYMDTVERPLRLPGARLADVARWWLSGAFFGWSFALPLWVLVITGAAVLWRTGRKRPVALAGGAATLHIGIAMFTQNQTESLRYILPALPFLALLAGGTLASPGRWARRVATAAVTVWCLAAAAWTSPALIERQKPGPVWAALTWIKTHCDPAITLVEYDHVMAPQVQYVLGRAGFRTVDIKQASPFLGGDRREEQTLFVTPRPVPGAEVLFTERQGTARVVQLAWHRYRSCAVSRARAGERAVFSPEWQPRGGGWELRGTGRIALPARVTPAIARLCAGGETITVRRTGWPDVAVAPGRCAIVPLLPAPGGEVVVSAPADAAALVPPIRILPLAALDGSAGLASAYMVPQAAHLPGLGGAAWRTDLVLFNPQPHPLAVTAQFLAMEKDNSTAPAATTTLAAGQVLDVVDVLSLPAFRPAAMGALLVRATAGGAPCTSAACDFLVLSRTYNRAAGPGFWRSSEWLPGVAPAQALRAGERATFSHVTRSDAVGASVGVASWTDAPVRVEVRTVAAGGAVVERHDFELAPFGHVHEPLAAAVQNGRVEVELLDPPPQAMIVPYVSMVDRAGRVPVHELADRLPSRTDPAGWVPPFPALRVAR